MNFPQNEGSKRVVLKKIPLFDLLKLMEHLYESGADFVDIVGISMGEHKQDELMIAVKDEYMTRKGDDDDDDDDDEWEEMKDDMVGSAEIISDVEDDELPGKKIQARITEQDLNDLLE